MVSGSYNKMVRKLKKFKIDQVRVFDQSNYYSLNYILLNMDFNWAYKQLKNHINMK